MTITTDDTTYYAPPPWIDLDAVLPAELRDRIAEVGAESLTLFPAVKAWSEKARALGWEVQEHIAAQVEALEHSLGPRRLGPARDHRRGSGCCSRSRLDRRTSRRVRTEWGRCSRWSGACDRSPMTAEQIAGVEAIRAQEVQAAQG